MERERRTSDTVAIYSLLAGIALSTFAVWTGSENAAARKALSVELLSDTYGDCLPEDMANPAEPDMSHPRLVFGPSALTVDAPTEGDAPYVYDLQANEGGDFVLVPGNDLTWTALAAAGCEFPVAE